MFSWHWGYIAGWLMGIAIITFLSLYPFYLIRYKPERYRGFWKTTGEMLKTPRRAVLFPIGYTG